MNLLVEVREASNVELIEKELLWPTPYAIITIGLQKQQTEAKTHTICPQWYQEFKFEYFPKIID
jgi:hypothetical protein